MMIYVKYFLWGLIGCCVLPVVVPILLMVTIGYITERTFNAFWRCA